MARPCFSEKGRVDVEINKVAQVGAGYMGGGIAQSLANAGFQVRLADVDADATRKAHERLLAEAEQFQAQGLFPPGSTDRIRENLHVAPSIEEAVADVDFVEEAVPEVPGIKRDVLARVEAAARPGTIIGTNTSTIPVHVLAEGMKDPSRFLTVHWSNPAPFIPGVEIVAGERTDPGVIPVVERMLARAGRRSAQVADVPGFVLNRLQYVLLKEAMTIVEEGVATATDIDTIVTSTFGFRLPFSAPSRSPTWPAWTSTPTASRPWRRPSGSASRRRRSSPTSSPRASSGSSRDRASSSSTRRSGTRSSRTGTRPTAR